LISAKGKEANIDGERVSITVKPACQGYKQRIRNAGESLINLEDYVLQQKLEVELKQQKLEDEQIQNKLIGLIDKINNWDEEPKVAQETKGGLINQFVLLYFRFIFLLFNIL
jgi:hypothetical protein